MVSTQYLCVHCHYYQPPRGNPFSHEPLAEPDAEPYKNWNEVGPGLPKARILAYGPPPTSGTSEAFIELAMEGGAAKLPKLAKLKKDDEKTFKATVSPMRNDGGRVTLHGLKPNTVHLRSASLDFGRASSMPHSW